MTKSMTEVKKKMGRPPVDTWKDEYCDMLIQHMDKGGSFESFAGQLRCGKDRLYGWLKEHPEFQDARNIGMGKSLLYYEGMFKALYTGQLRRVKSEKPVLDRDGKPVLDPNTGDVLYDREFEGVNGNAASLIFTMKNMHGWRDKRDIGFLDPPSNPGDAQRPASSEPSPEQKLRAIIEVQKVLLELDENDLGADAVSIAD